MTPIYFEGCLIWVRASEFVGELREFSMKSMPQVRYWKCSPASLASCFVTNRDNYVQEKMYHFLKSQAFMPVWNTAWCVYSM